MDQDLAGITSPALLGRSLWRTGDTREAAGDQSPSEGVHGGWRAPRLVCEQQQQPGAGIYFSFSPLCCSDATGGKFRSSHHPRQRY